VRCISDSTICLPALVVRISSNHQFLPAFTSRECTEQTLLEVTCHMLGLHSELKLPCYAEFLHHLPASPLNLLPATCRYHNNSKYNRQQRMRRATP
jgi:hypothetical protein